MSEQKTHADIIAEMNCGPIPEHRHDREILRYYAHSLDAAHRREVGALKQRCSELNAEVAAKDVVILRLNNAIAEEQRRKMATAEKSSVAGDCAKLRETLETVRKYVKEITPDKVLLRVIEIWCDEALAAPPRNCDVGTAEELSRRFDKVCSFRFTGNCAGCQNPLDDSAANGVSDCALFWAQMPYVEKEGGAK